MFEIFPFIFLITVKFFYLNLNEKNEIEILNSNGISNLKIISNINNIISYYWYIFIIILLFFFIKFKK